jgi:riboflavin biosynthesis pyrimidine reductase
MKRPHITTYSLASLDGKLTISPDTLLLFGDERWTACAGTSEDVYRWIMSTLHPDALLEGSGSLVPRGASVEPLPDPSLPQSELLQDYLPDRIVDVENRKWLVVTDSRGLIRWMYKEFPGEEWAGWYILVLVSNSTPAAYLDYLRREDIPYLMCGEGKVDLDIAMKKLSSLGIRKLVSTAGGNLSGALLRKNLVDDVWIEFFPALIGGTHTPGLFNAPDMLPGETPLPLTLQKSEVLPNQHIRLFFTATQEKFE